ncbi:hypothetical protein JS756_32735 [Streptomyces actuosus]|uniref:Uncharacterized protein n=1 Tax=Streptomyces actuosus TaxID=1885 RepID=A0ABS2W029_STRAS|nr:hypothetical protein [Streptomyces actuosus]MBN0048767.1 hypothetical protein [Streptomyces actuosus]
MTPETNNSGIGTAARCDLCEAPITDEHVFCTHVRDSSYLHPHDRHLDGDRPLTACSAEHLNELIKKVGARPFANEELWAGKMARVLAAHSQSLSLYALAMETGLTQDQIAQAAFWAGRAEPSQPASESLPGPASTGPEQV